MTDQIGDVVKGFKGVMGVAAINLLSGEQIVVNPDTAFPTASTIKTAVMVEAYHRAKDGTLPLDAPIVLRDADKVATNLLVNRRGAAKILYDKLFLRFLGFLEFLLVPRVLGSGSSFWFSSLKTSKF